MKKNLFPIILMVMLFFAACKKDNANEGNAPVPVPIPTPVQLDDTARVRLKDIVSTNLPSPYYHFEYDNQKYVTRINFASGLDRYMLQYENKRVKRMINTINGNQLLYTYSNAKVSLITEFSGITREKLWEYFFAYNAANQLTEIRWIRYSNGGTTSHAYRRLTFAYHADGNLQSFTDFFADSNGQLQFSSTTKYLDYDAGVNVDDFSSFKNFFETLLYLPAVKLQKNNARTVLILGTDNDYKINYTYQYSNGLPVVKAARMQQTRGTGTGNTTNFSTTFIYY